MSVRMLIALLAAVLLFSCATAQSALIPSEELNACVPANRNDTVVFTCSGGSDFILWRVASRQIRDAVGGASTEFEGIFVTTTNSSEGFSSSIVFTASGLQFLSETVGGMQFEVACLVELSLFNIVEADTRAILIYSTPPPPEDLQLIPISPTLQWTRPRTPLDCVPINYLVTINNIDTGDIIVNEELEESEVFTDVDELDSDLCQLYEFQVLSVNDGGRSQPVILRATLPISPDVDDISSSLTARPLFEDGEILIEVTFQPATTCNETTHPIENYMIEILELPEFNASLPHSDQPLALTLTSSSLEEDMYTVIVSACAEFGCFPADPVTVVTSEVQSASITFLNTTVSLECWFTATGSGDGCRFSLELPDGQTETLHVDRPSNGSLRAQQCDTTENRREAYVSFKVEAIGSDGGFQLEPFVNVTEDLADIAPCEPPPPEVIMDVVKESLLSTGEVVAIVIGALVVFSLLVILAGIIVWWKRQEIRSAYQHWVQPVSEDQGIELMMEGGEEKPTIMMLMKNLIPHSPTTATSKKKKSVTREVSHQPDLATAISKEGEAEMGLRYSDGAQPSSPPPLSGKEPVAAIKMKGPEEPNSLQLLLKPATLSRVVQMWKSKANRGEEMLLYWKEDEEDVDDDEPYYEDPEDSV